MLSHAEYRSGLHFGTFTREDSLRTLTCEDSLRTLTCEDLPSRTREKTFVKATRREVTEVVQPDTLKGR
jgi:hypothetical protein